MKATSAKFSRKDFLNPVIPEDYKEKTLTLMYSDLYQETSDGSYVAFDQLKKFLNKDSNNNVFENYKSYVDKRNMLKAINNYEDY